QVRRTPERVALVCGEQELSYAELERRANRLARWLRRQGVGVETRVGVLLQREVELVVSLLAVLAAGGAYVPLDPEYPEERLRLMLEDSGATLLLTQADLAGRLSQVPEAVCRRILLAPSGLPVDDLPLAAVPAAPVPGDLAYLIYTSGS